MCLQVKAVFLIGGSALQVIRAMVSDGVRDKEDTGA